MLLAKESTEVAEQNQNRWASQQSARGEEFALERDEVEVEIDPHRNMMRAPEHRYVFPIPAAPAVSS